MKKIIFLISIFISSMTLWHCENEIIEPTFQDSNLKYETAKTKVHKSKLQNREFISNVLLNNPMGNTEIRKMQVYTPPGYDHKREIGYPVVYLLHGLPFSEKAYIESKIWDNWINPNGVFKVYPDFPQEGFRIWVDNLIQVGKIEPMIIVMPNAENMNYGFSFYTNSALNGNFEDYIVYDLVNFIDKRYNTIANRNGRAVIGNSQGGYAAFLFGMKHPDVFGTVASHSGMIVLDLPLSMGSVLIAENPNGFTGPDPTKIFTSAAYAMSSAWSPNLNNPPFFVDFPFEYPSGDINESVRERWLENDPFTLLDTYANNFRSLNGIYFDCGSYDELNICAANDYMKQKLDAYGINYTYEGFDGGHFSNIFSRLEKSLSFCSNTLSN